MILMCSHKAPWVLMPGDKTFTKYVCIDCERKLLKKMYGTIKKFGVVK